MCENSWAYPFGQEAWLNVLVFADVSDNKFASLLLISKPGASTSFYVNSLVTIHFLDNWTGNTDYCHQYIMGKIPTKMIVPVQVLLFQFLFCA